MIQLTKADFEKMLAHAEKELPDEACGLIAGEVQGTDKIIKKVYLLTNIDHSNEHFSLDPKEQLATVKDMRANGLVPLGNWHSHPESPSRPSEEDKRLAYDSKASYMILSLMDREHPVLNSFHIEGTDAEKESAKQTLILHNLRLVAHIAKKYNNAQRESEELISIGIVGLIKAILSYDSEKSIRLATYASRCIENAILSRMRLWFQINPLRAEKNQNGVF